MIARQCQKSGMLALVYFVSSVSHLCRLLLGDQGFSDFRTFGLCTCTLDYVMIAS